MRTPIAAVGLGLGGLLLLSSCSREAEASEEPPATVDQAAATVEVAATESAPSVSYDPRRSLAPMIKRVGPAVVSIRAFGKKAAAPRASFFGRSAPPRETRSSGSGFILSTDGTVITNHHVVDGAQRLEVHLTDGRKFEADLVGSDPATDLAVLAVVDGDELPTVELGNSGALEVGDWVVAIGSPMGLEHSASVGILSGRGRGNLGLYEGDSYLDFLQTDADIAPGSSGGPLFDLEGRVVGITTAVGAGSRPGFAIPIDQAKEIVPKIRDTGKVVRGWLGAASDPQSDAEGATIGQVFEETPAAEAGLRSGDVVKTVDGDAIADFDALRRTIAALDPGHTVLMEVERDGSTVELSAVLDARPDPGARKLRPLTRRSRRDASPPQPPAPPSSSRGGGPRLGVQAREADGGLEVVRIEAGSLADDLDLQPGDLIVQLNGETIASRQDVADALARSRDRVAIEVLRDGVKHKVTLEKS